MGCQDLAQPQCREEWRQTVLGRLLWALRRGGFVRVGGMGAGDAVTLKRALMPWLAWMLETEDSVLCYITE